MTAQRGDTVAEDWGESRSRVVTWHDPGPSTARGLTMAGLDYLLLLISPSTRRRSAEAFKSFDLLIVREVATTL